MPEFYITGYSNPAPFCGDQSDAYVDATTPEGALIVFMNDYSHPSGLYSAQVWANHKHYLARRTTKPLAEVVLGKG